MKAVILAGGKGTRLLPYTSVFPKPLMPVGDRPIVDIILHQLAYYGFNDIVLSVGHLGGLIQAYFHNKREAYVSLALSYVYEEQPLGTAGPVKLIPGLGDTPFMTINGDLLTTLNFKKMMEFHCATGSLLTVGIHQKRIKIDLGVIAIDGRGRVTDYTEKPEQCVSVSMGINVYSPEVLDYIMPNEYLDFPTLVTRLIKAGECVMSYPCDGHWLDIGNQNDYIQAQEEFALRKNEYLPNLTV